MKRTVPILLATLAVSAMPLALQALAQETEIPATAEADQLPAPAPVPATSAADQAKTVSAITEALEAVKTASGRFSQINPDFSVEEGDFAIQRPGRIRFDYDEPSPTLLVADGTTVAIENRDLETFDRIPIGQTPLKLLFGSEIDVEDDVDVVRLVETETETILTVRDAGGDTQGELSMILSPKTYNLLGWRVIDASGALTSVQLEDVKTNNRLSPRLFRIEDPEDEDDE